MKQLYESPTAEISLISAIDVASGSGPNRVSNQGAGSEGSGLIVDIEDFFGGES